VPALNASVIENHGFLVSSRVQLSELEDEHLESIYRITFSDKTRHLWAPNLEQVSQEKFCDYLKRRIDHRWSHFKVITSSHDSRVLGFCYCYQSSSVNKTANLCLCMDPNILGSFSCLQAGYLYFAHVFFDLGYRKLYAEVLSYNKQCIQILRKLAFPEEGCLKDHQYWQEKYWDLHLFSVTEGVFYQLCQSKSDVVGKLSCYQQKN
jgi:RimJ/RimL family protein N-acetyltransferase